MARHAGRHGEYIGDAGGPRLRAFRRWKPFCALAVAMISTILLYNNCGESPGRYAAPGGVEELESLTGCEIQIFRAFEEKIYPFTSQNCAACHSGKGPSNDPFAAGNLRTAFEAFNVVGMEKFKTYATNAGHVPGVTGPDREPEMVAIEDALATVESSPECRDGGGAQEEGMARTTEKELNAPQTSNQSQGAIRRWNLASELARGQGAFGRATFALTVRYTIPAGGVPTYFLSRPTIGPDQAAAIEVRNVMIFINGKRISTATTFQGIDRVVPPGFVPQSLSNSTLIVEMPGGIQPTDTIAIEFAHLAPAGP